MSDPEDQDNLPFELSSIAAIGARRRWRLFGRREDPEVPLSTGEADDAPIHRSMLETLASREDHEVPLSTGEADDAPIHQSMLEALASREDPGVPLSAGEADDAPIHQSMLGTLASRNGGDVASQPERRSLLALDRATGDPQPDGGQVLVGPLVAHSTLAELAGLEEHPSGSFPIERGILISIVLHVLLVTLLLVAPTRIPTSGKGDLFALPEPEPSAPIPISFQDLPGPSRPNPNRSTLSDADRRASGGDPSKPKSESPFIPPSRGVAGLAPGPKAPRVAGSQVPARPGASARAERRAPGEPGEKLAERKPSEFPTDMRPQMGSGPREISKLAGLDRAIQEAARGTLGGEGGAPAANEEGGFVDSGPISFDTSWYDWGPYAAEMVRRIKLHWDVPELARLGWKGSLTVRFYILADGRVADAKILRTSGIPPFDFAAFQAILKSSPFRPLPADLHEEREGITVTFFYNLRPEDEVPKGKPAKSP